MGRKVGLAAAVLMIAVLSAGLVGGQVGDGGFLWWGTREPIYIYGNGDFTVENGVMSGSGTAADPYIIEGWRIDAPKADYGVTIDHTTAYFVIRDCVIERARIAGIAFNSVTNGTVEALQISRSDTAMQFLNSDGNTITGSVIAQCRYGIVFEADSKDNRIFGNSFLENGLNGIDAQRRNWWSNGGRGNYWSDYTGLDENADGIGDDPYDFLWDAYPLMNPPVAWTDVTTAGLTYGGKWVSPDGKLVVTSQTPITLSSADPGSGLAEIRYAIDGGTWAIYEQPILLTGEDGPRRITYYAVDCLGNQEPKKTISFILDNHPPMTVPEIGDPKCVDERGTWVTSKTPITLRRVQESTYGRTVTCYRIDGGNWHQYSRPFVLYAADGPHQVTFYSRNASGVTEPLQTILLLKDDAPPSTRGAQASASVVVDVLPSTTAEVEPAVVETASEIVEPVIEETPVAVVEEPAPVVEEPVVVEEPAPVIEEPAIEEEPAPPVEEPATPAESSTAPVGETEVSAVQTPSEIGEPSVQTEGSGF